MKKIAILPLLVLAIAGATRCKKNSTANSTEQVTVTTIAGTGNAGYLDASALSAQFSTPRDVAVHTDGTLYIADRDNHRIRKISPNGLVSTFAGNDSLGNTNGNGNAASFWFPSLVTLDTPGNVYVSDPFFFQVRKITPGADVSAYAGTGSIGFADGKADTALFGVSQGIVADAQGNIFIADEFNQRIRMVSNDWVYTIAGTGIPGYADGSALQAQFKKPFGMAIDQQGNLYVCDNENFRIRKITPAGSVSTLAGSGIQGIADGTASSAQFDYPFDMVADKKGNLYVIDRNRIRKVTLAGEVSTIAGGEPGFADGPGSIARFRTPAGLGIDKQGNIYVADSHNHRIRKISFE